MDEIKKVRESNKIIYGIVFTIFFLNIMVFYVYCKNKRDKSNEIDPELLIPTSLVATE